MDASKALESTNLFTLHIFKTAIPIANSIVMMWIIMAVLIVLSVIFTRNLKTIPSGKQNITEIVVETITKLIKSTMGRHGRDFVPYFGTILLFLVFANVAGVFNILPSASDMYKMTGLAFFKNLPAFTIDPPTKDLNITVTMALMTVGLVMLAGIKYKRHKGLPCELFKARALYDAVPYP